MNLFATLVDVVCHLIFLRISNKCQWHCWTSAETIYILCPKVLCFKLHTMHILFTLFISEKKTKAGKICSASSHPVHFAPKTKLQHKKKEHGIEKTEEKEKWSPAYLQSFIFPFFLLLTHATMGEHQSIQCSDDGSCFLATVSEQKMKNSNVFCLSEFYLFTLRSIWF